MDPSKFHFYSFGEVAANKPRRDDQGNICDLLEVFPKEKFSMSAGEITDNVEKVDVQGKDANAEDYQGQLESKPSITCKWLPLGEPNRITPPDVRRGEMVQIYRYADTDYFFWSTSFNNVVRKLETVAWWFSGHEDESISDRGQDNGYLIELSTHEKHLLFSTSKMNGEKARYFLQFDAGNGNFMVKDDLGQHVFIDSVAGIIEITSDKEIIHNTKKYTINCEEYILNCKTSVVNAEDSVETNTKVSTLNADDSVETNTKASTLNADDTAETNTETFTVNAGETAEFDTPLTHATGAFITDGMLTYKGGMTGSGGSGAAAKISGTVQADEVVASGKSLTTHKHADPQGGFVSPPV